MTTRQLAARAGTSHSTLSAYENGRTTPRVDTLARILRAAGFACDLALDRRVDGHQRAARGRELVEALELAAAFPADHDTTLRYPTFPGT